MYFAESVAGFERIWVFGDYFGFNSFAQFYHQRPESERRGYMMLNYEVSGFLNSKYRSLDGSIFGRLRSLYTSALTTHVWLPKLIIVVPDDDILKYIRKKKWSVQDVLKPLLNWLMSEYNKTTLAYKEYMPEKAKKEKQPYFIWIECPLHKNFPNNEDHRRFNVSLQEVARRHENM